MGYIRGLGETPKEREAICLPWVNTPQADACANALRAGASKMDVALLLAASTSSPVRQQCRPFAPADTDQVGKPKVEQMAIIGAVLLVGIIFFLRK